MNEDDPHPFSPNHIRTFEGHEDFVKCIAAVDDSGFLSAAGDGTAKLWNAETGECIKTCEGGRSCHMVVTKLDNERFIAGFDTLSGNNLILMNVATGERIRSFRGHHDSVTIVLRVSDTRFLSGSADCTIKLWDAETGNSIRTFRGHDLGVMSLDCNNGTTFISGSSDGSVKRWDVDSGDCIQTIDVTMHRLHSLRQDDTFPLLSATDFIACMGQTTFLSASMDISAPMNLWNIDTEHIIRSMETKGVSSVASIDDKRALVVEVLPHGISVDLWDVAHVNRNRTFHGHRDNVNSVAILSKSTFVSASCDNTLMLWEHTSWPCVKHLVLLQKLVIRNRATVSDELSIQAVLCELPDGAFCHVLSFL